MSDRRSSRSPGEIVYSYSQGTLIRSRDMETDSHRRRRHDQPREKKEKVIILRQNGRSVYRNSPEPEIIRERRVVRSVSNPTYVSGPTGYVVRRATKSSKSSYSSRTGTGSTTLTSTGSSGSYTDTSETCSTCSVTDSTTSYDSRPVRRRTVQRRFPSNEIEGYAARQFRSQRPGSWRIIQQREPGSIVERERGEEPVYTEVRRVTETVRRAQNTQASNKEDDGSATESETEDTYTDETASQKSVIEKGFQDRMDEYRSQKYRNVATQMITHYVPQEEEPKEEIITHNVNTQTEEQERKRPPKLPKDRYKTAIIIPETTQKAYHTDDEIEVVVKKDPGLIEEIVRKPEPPPILVQEIDLRPPPPEPVPDKKFGPKRKYIPPPPVSLQFFLSFLDYCYMYMSCEVR